jgi:phosphatidylserine/phosphatidylglycerophosphate/cardiolipin synthase-like enzyme
MSPKLLVSLRNIVVLGIFLFASAAAWALSCIDVVQIQKELQELPTQESQVKYKVISNPREALATTVSIIRDAQHTLDISSYILRPDQSGRIIISEIEKAATRGVSIRLLVDSFGSLTTLGELATLLKYKNVEVTSFNSITNWKRYPKSIALWVKEMFGFQVTDRSADKFFLNRLHDKIMIADLGHASMMVLVGGRNLANPDFGVGKATSNFLDLSFLFKPDGNAKNFANDIGRYFESIYYHQTNQILVDPKFGIFSNDASRIRRMKEAIASNDWLDSTIEFIQASGSNHQNFESASIRLVHELQNVTRKRNLFNFSTYNWKAGVNVNSISRSLREAIRSARKHVRVITPYLILNANDLQQMKDSLLMNPDLKIEFLTNSLKSTNHPSTQLIFEALILPDLLELKNHPDIGARLSIFMLDPKSNDQKIEGILHSKLVEIDGHFLATSSNFDLISRFSNSESGFWVNPLHQNQEVQNYINKVKDHSILVGSDAWKAEQLSAKQKGWQSLKIYLGKFLQWFHIRLLQIG